MNIREWFGFNGEYDETLDINRCVDGLLELYSKALMKYFSLETAASYQDILQVDVENLNRGQKLFLDWLEEKGIPYLKDLTSKHLPSDDNLISKIDYDKYILEEEMGFEYPDDIRTSLINIVNDVPEYIKATNEVSVSINVNEVWDNWSPWLTEPITTTSQGEFFHYFLEGNDYMVSNYRESASTAGSLFLCRGAKVNGNLGVLQVNKK